MPVVRDFSSTNIAAGSIVATQRISAPVVRAGVVDAESLIVNGQIIDGSGGGGIGGDVKVDNLFATGTVSAAGSVSGTTVSGGSLYVTGTAQAGSFLTGGSVHAGDVLSDTGIVASTGDILAITGDIVANDGDVKCSGYLRGTYLNVEATALIKGGINSGGKITATSTTGTGTVERNFDQHAMGPKITLGTTQTTFETKTSQNLDLSTELIGFTVVSILGTTTIMSAGTAVTIGGRTLNTGDMVEVLIVNRSATPITITTSAALMVPQSGSPSLPANSSTKLYIYFINATSVEVYY